MRRWRYALLVFELFLFALILVLPQVDLPDFTFPGGSAPIAAKAKLSSPPVFSVAPAPVQVRSTALAGETRSRTLRPAAELNPLSSVTLNTILRC